MLNKSIAKLTAITAFVGVAVITAGHAFANHAWGPYHWARTTPEFSLALGDNLNNGWDSYLQTTSNDWSLSSVLDTTIVNGRTNARRCNPTAGQVEVCNYRYGSTGWLGIAQIWIDRNGHIGQGVVKLNDTYFNTSTYNTPAWKNLVMCQEVGHTFGLGHQDENFYNANLDTCMDYTAYPESNQHPNQHDYDMLETIYGHLDSYDSYNATLSARSSNNKAKNNFDNPSDWGQLMSNKDGNKQVYKKVLDDGSELLTHVFWIDEDHADHDHE